MLDPTGAVPEHPRDGDLTEALRPLASGATTPAERPLRAPNFPTGSRFEEVYFLGQGGMGQVFRAFDPRLKRAVALKLAMGELAEDLERFTREAQAQARVDHPHVAKVFEVGEIGGRPYFSMQYIEGRTLKEMAAELSAAEKARIMLQVAEGVHAAHRIGLLHRDIKPVNVMVERAEDGRLHPYVLDFGLVRNLEGPGMTIGAFAMGTPAYMSPEQAMGRASALDVRSDVYSLGATLYEALAGRPVYGEASAMEVLRNVMDKDPEPLRKVAPQVPEDLALIVHKCLEREMERRYDGAQALAEDLRRFLEGRPVLARAPSQAYRFSKWVGRNRTLALVGGVSALALLLVSGLALRAVLRTRRQALVAAGFATQVERIQAHLSLAYLSPLHDVRGQEEEVKARLERLRSDIAQAGSLGAGPGYCALGRGYLAQSKLDLAKDALDRAWAAGYRTPQAAAARAEAYMRLLRRAREDAGRATDPKARAAQLEPAIQGYRAVATEMLGLAQGETADQDYARAQLAFLHGDMEAALEGCRRTLQEAPWRYEACYLQYWIHQERAWDAHRAGQAAPRASEAQAATEALDAAVGIGRSDPQLFMERVEWHLDLARMDATGGAASMDHLREAIEDCGRAAQARPGWASPLSRRSEILFEIVGLELAAGRDTAADAKREMEDAEEAVRLEPGSNMAQLALGRALLMRVEAGVRRGDADPAEMARAAEALERAYELSPDEPNMPRTLSYARYLQAVDARERGQDPRPYLRMSLEAVKGGIRIDPKEALNFGATADVQLELAQAERGAGADAGPLLEDAARNFEQGLRLSPGQPQMLKDLAEVHRVKGQLALDQGADPAPELAKARELLAQASSAAPDFAEPPQEGGSVELVEASRALAAGADPGPALAKAEAEFQRAARLNPKAEEDPEGLAEAAWIGARAAQKQGRSPAAAVRKGLAAAEAALKLNPKAHRAQALRAALRQAAGEPGAAAELAAALHADPLLARDFGGAKASR